MSHLVRESLAIVIGAILLTAILLGYPLTLVIPICLVIVLCAWLSSNVGMSDE